MSQWNQLKNWFLIGFLGLLAVTATASCGTIGPEERNQEYVITGRIPSNPEDHRWYIVTDTESGAQKTAIAIKEMSGRYYLPFMSRMPEFNHQIVEGYFAVDSTAGFPRRDTVFVVTRMVRYTPVATVGK